MEHKIESGLIFPDSAKIIHGWYDGENYLVKKLRPD